VCAGGGCDVIGRVVIPFMVIAALLGAACGPQQPSTGAASPAASAAGSAAATAAGQQPTPGGELIYIVTAEPPTFDAHQSTTFATLQPISPHYSTLYKLDPADNVSKIVPDAADGLPQISADKLTWTIKLRPDVKFHDGTQLTSEDVKATYDKLKDPPQGVVSPRQATLAAVDKIEATDKLTVTFKMKYATGSFLAALASPWNYLYSAAKLKQDPKFYEKNIMGTGPFLFVEYQKGSFWAGKKNPDYFIKGRPYLDSYKAVFITDVNRQTTAIQSEQAMIEFRGFTPQQRQQLSSALGNKLAIQESPWVCVNYISYNTTKKPFDDVRVRQALNLAVDRWAGSEALSKQTIVKDVGGLMRPKGPFAMSDADLEKIQGFSRDGKASKDQAKKLLADAGFTADKPLTFKFLNRQVTTPYEPVALFLIDQWKQVGIVATHDVKETAAYTADLRNKNFDVGLDFNCDYFDEPDLQLAKFYSASGLGKGLNLSHYDDPQLDKMIDAQSRETDVAKRQGLLKEIEKYAMETKAYMQPVLWWYRILPYNARVRGYVIGSNHYTTMDMANIWLAPK
jgi:peptide/nickel transport system substrate-binding protein